MMSTEFVQLSVSCVSLHRKQLEDCIPFSDTKPQVDILYTKQATVREPSALMRNTLQVKQDVKRYSASARRVWFCCALRQLHSSHGDFLDALS